MRRRQCDPRPTLRELAAPFVHVWSEEGHELIVVRRRVLLWLAMAGSVTVTALALVALGLTFRTQARAERVQSVVCGRQAFSVDALTVPQAARFERVCGVRVIRAGSELKVVRPGK